MCQPAASLAHPPLTPSPLPTHYAILQFRCGGQKLLVIRTHVVGSMGSDGAGLALERTGVQKRRWELDRPGQVSKAGLRERPPFQRKAMETC